MFLLLILICALLALTVIYPMWLFATNFPSSYSIIVTVLLFALLTKITFSKIKKHGLSQSLIFASKSLCIILALTFFSVLVVHGKTLFALLALAFFSALYALLKVKFKSAPPELASEKK